MQCTIFATSYEFIIFFKIISQGLSHELMNLVSDPQWLLTSQKESQLEMMRLLMEAHNAIHEGVSPKGKRECDQT